MAKITSSVKKGFTIIELTLSMAFVGVLLVTIAMITINIISIYQKGLSIRAVNDTGRELVDEFSRAIATVPTKSFADLCDGRFIGSALAKCREDGGQLFIYQENHSNSSIDLAKEYSLNGVDTTVNNPPTHGAFCTGHYTYIWNTGYVLNPNYGLSNHISKIRYSDGTTHVVPADDEDPIRLIRVTDETRGVCSSHINGDYSITESDIYDITDGYEFTYNMLPELLENTEDNLAIYDFQVFRPTQHHITYQSFFSGTFILATLQGSVNITSAGDYCTEIPDDLATDFAYCAINKFNFAMRATGESYDTNQRNY